MRQSYEHYRDSWYEQRKRSLLLGALTQPYYRRAFEPGCAYANLTAALAQRCDDVVAVDCDPATVARAREIMGLRRNVYISTMRVPQEWPPGHFDLVVLGEFLYYLPPPEIRRVAEHAAASLLEGGELVACHSRRAVADTGLSGDDVHTELHAALPLKHVFRHQESDFVLETWWQERCALAACEGWR